MKKLLLKLSILVSCIYSLTLFNSCNEVPVDIPLVQDTLELNALSSNDVLGLIESKEQHYKELKGPFNSQLHLLGRSGEYKSHLLYRFFGLPKDMAYITEDDIKEATLYLFPDQYTFGDTVNFEQELNVYELLDSISREDRFSDIFDASDNSPYMINQIGSFIGNSEPKDSIPIKINLEKWMILKWFQFAAKEDSIRKIWLDTSQTLDLTKEENRYLFHSYSIGLVAGQNSKVINRFINRIDLDSVYNTQIRLVVNKQGKDTTIRLKNSIGAFYPHVPEIEESEDIYLQGLGQTRTVFNFNIDTIPPLSAILSCQLKLTLDTENSEFGSFGPSIYLAGSENEDPFYVPGSENLNSWPYIAFKDTIENVYTFTNLTPLLDSWNRKDGKGNLVLAPARGTNPSTEFTYFDKYKFYGLNHPDTNKRPKLLIIYSRRPEI